MSWLKFDEFILLDKQLDNRLANKSNSNYEVFLCGDSFLLFTPTNFSSFNYFDGETLSIIFGYHIMATFTMKDLGALLMYSSNWLKRGHFKTNVLQFWSTKFKWQWLQIKRIECWNVNEIGISITFVSINPKNLVKHQLLYFKFICHILTSKHKH